MKFIQSTSRTRHEMRIHLSSKEKKKKLSRSNLKKTFKEEEGTIIEFMVNDNNLL